MTPTKTKRIGLLVEDYSDFYTVQNIVNRIPSRSQVVLRKAIARGCTRIHSKCKRLAADLRRKNCEGLIIIRDSDGNDEDALRSQILSAVRPSPIQDHVVVIPVQAIEAWLLADIDAIRQVFDHTQHPLKEFRAPEKINQPKHFLETFVRTKMGKRYLNTVHNPKIAARLDLSKALRCPSFKPLYDYILAC